MRTTPKLRLALGGLVALCVLPGCQGERIIARVNDTPITEREYVHQMEGMNQLLPGLDAGGSALVTLVQRSLLDQRAASLGARPTDEEVRRFAEYIRRIRPDFDDAIRAKRMDESSFLSDMRVQLEEFVVGSDGAKASQEQIQAAYEKNKARLTFPEVWTVRLLEAPDKALGEKALARLRKTGDFQTEAHNMGQAPGDVANAGREISVIASGANMAQILRIAPQLRDALVNVKPGDFVAEPIPVTPNAQAPNQVTYVIAQIVRKLPENNPTLEEARVALNQIAISDLHPQWQLHAGQDLASYTGKSSIQIYVDRYKPLLTSYIIPQALAHAAGSGAPPAPAQDGAAGGAAPDSGAAPTPGSDGMGGSGGAGR